MINIYIYLRVCISFAYHPAPFGTVCTLAHLHIAVLICMVQSSFAYRSPHLFIATSSLTKCSFAAVRGAHLHVVLLICVSSSFAYNTRFHVAFLEFAYHSQVICISVRAHSRVMRVLINITMPRLHTMALIGVSHSFAVLICILISLPEPKKKHKNDPKKLKYPKMPQNYLKKLPQMPPKCPKIPNKPQKSP